MNKTKQNEAKKAAVNTTEVEAKCVDCGAKRWIKAGEVPAGEQPTCRCGSFMVSTGKARAV